MSYILHLVLPFGCGFGAAVRAQNKRVTAGTYLLNCGIGQRERRGKALRKVTLSLASSTEHTSALLTIDMQAGSRTD